MTAWKLSTHRWISEGKDGERTYRLPAHSLEGRCDDANMESSTIPRRQIPKKSLGPLDVKD